MRIDETYRKIGQMISGFKCLLALNIDEDDDDIASSDDVLISATTNVPVSA